MADPYLSQRALPPQVKRTLGQLRAVEGPGSAPGPSPIRPALAAARAPRARPAAPAAHRRVDCSGRLNIKALCAALGWGAGTAVGLRPGTHGYTATRTDRPGGRNSLTGTVDGDGRLRLPPAIRTALDPDGSNLVLARACGDALELYPAAIVDDLLDGLAVEPTRPALASVPTGRNQP